MNLFGHEAEPIMVIFSPGPSLPTAQVESEIERLEGVIKAQGRAMATELLRGLAF